MLYRENPKNGDKISILGFGCMRLARKGTGIDQAKCNEQLSLALERGINFFDTAYIYPGVEAAVGRFHKTYGCRDKMFISAKLPHYLVKKAEDFEKLFSEELKRLQTDYIDYYLIHMLNDVSSWERLVSLGIVEWISKQKKSGRIRNIGFSFHGGTTAFNALLDIYPWEFTLVQFNYMDEHSQAGIDGIREAHKRGLPVFIMEPLRGGRLAQLTPEAQKILDKSSLQYTAPELSFRWIWDHPEITMVLSGMNSIEQIEHNVRSSERSLPNCMTEHEKATVVSIREALKHGTKVNCTGCRYCMPCPRGVDIPTCFAAYNDMYSHSWFLGMKEYFMCTTLRKQKANASLCVGCGLCEQHCPQSIEIRKELKNVSSKMEGFCYKVARLFCKLIGRNY